MAYSMSRGGRSGSRVALVIVAFVVISVIRQSRNGDADADEATRADETPYVAAGDEGVGASVAILIDNSGSMEKRAPGDSRAKYLVAREALQAMLAATDAFVARQPDFPIQVGLYRFSDEVVTLAPIARYDRARLASALAAIPKPVGGTAIGRAMEVARADLYRAGTIRKHILVLTDGENTDGRSPRSVGEEIQRRSGGAVRMYFVAFDVNRESFAFVREQGGELLGARDGRALAASLDTIYRGRILAEAVGPAEASLLPTTSSRPPDQ